MSEIQKLTRETNYRNETYETSETKLDEWDSKFDKRDK